MIKLVPDILETFQTDVNGKSMIMINWRSQEECDTEGTNMVMTVSQTEALIGELEEACRKARNSHKPLLEDI